MLTSLELLPMWAGVEPDVALFASGRVLDEGGDWSGGHPLSDAGDHAGAWPRSMCSPCHGTPYFSAPFWNCSCVLTPHGGVVVASKQVEPGTLPSPERRPATRAAVT